MDLVGVSAGVGQLAGDGNRAPVSFLVGTGLGPDRKAEDQRP
jgi:hypothetical protein